MGPSAVKPTGRQAGQSDADYASSLNDLYSGGTAWTNDTGALTRGFGADAARGIQYLNEVHAHDAQNAQANELYQKSMLEQKMKMNKAPGRQGTILTGEPMTPTTNFKPTSIL